MVKTFGRLALIALLVFAGVTIWYGRVEKKIQGPPTSAKKEMNSPLAAGKPNESVSMPAEKEYQVILDRNIFKADLELTERPAGEQSQADLENLAETKMQLVLLGTVSGSKEDARAIIRDEESQSEDIYRVGSGVQGAIITKIGRGKVVLQVNGQEEILNIKEPESGEPQKRSSSRAENALPAMQLNSGDDRRIPIAVPRRRISFRNSPPPAAPEAATNRESDVLAEEQAVSVGEQEKQEDNKQPVPDDEALPAGGDEDGDGGPQTAK